jgi:rubrerythrin
MAVGHRLPNGYIVLLLTPREATLHRDQILAPEDYPWTNPSESQMVAMEIRAILEKAVLEDSLAALAMASEGIIQAARAEERKQKLEAEGKWECPNCRYYNETAAEACGDCGHVLLDKPQ